MITILVHGPKLVLNAAFLDHQLLVALTLITRNDLWAPAAIYAVEVDSLKFRIEQLRKQFIKWKWLVMLCKLDIRHTTEHKRGVFVPIDDEYPFESFARVDYDAVYNAAYIACSKSQDSNESIQTLWSK